MKYQQQIDIELSRDKVIELFDSTENLKKWQPGLVSFEHLSGQAGEVGAQSKIIYKMGKRECAMVETITTKNLPDEFTATYVSEGVTNNIANHFIEIDGNNTRWISDNEFQFDGIMLKLMGFLVPSMFKKESYKFMLNFKQFAESSK